MSDVLSREQRHKNMSHIRGKDTSIEILVRKYLFNRGFRFRKNDKRLPGKPDVVLPKWKTVIFIHGCFWHRHPNCKYATEPQTNRVFWNDKFKKTVERDISERIALETLGWKVLVVWECELRKNNFEDTMQKLIKSIVLCETSPVCIANSNVHDC